MSAEGIRLYDPTAEPRAVAATLAPRLATLDGKRLGILDNGKANAGTLMLAVATTRSASSTKPDSPPPSSS